MRREDADSAGEGLSPPLGGRYKVIMIMFLSPCYRAIRAWGLEESFTGSNSCVNYPSQRKRGEPSKLVSCLEWRVRMDNEDQERRTQCS